MKNYKIGITFGAFDPLHYGHIRIFQRAKEQCETLIAVISDGEYIKKHKKHVERFNFEERKKALESIKEIDIIGVQSLKFGKKEAIDYFKPDVIFVGDDWTPETFTGEGLGVEVVYLPHTEKISSTKLVR